MMKHRLLLSIYFLAILQFIRGQNSLIDLKGNNNTIKVVQGNGTVVYNLDNKEQYQSFLKYLKQLPQIKDEINSILNISKSTNQLLKALTGKSKSSGFFDPSIFLSEFGKLKIENYELRIQLENLKNQTSDEELQSILVKADKLLESYDNGGYQNILEEKKNKIKIEIDRGRKDIAKINFLQAKNNLSNGLTNKALEQILMAIEQDSADTGYLTFLGNVYLVKGEPYKALEYYQKTGLLETTVNSKLDYETSSQFVNIGYAYLWTGKPDFALRYFRHALLINQMLDTNANINSNSTYSGIAYAYERTCDYDKAIAYHKIALEMDKKLFGDTSRYVKMRYMRIGHDYLHKGNDEQAAFYFREAFSDLYIALWQAELYKEYGEREFDKNQYPAAIRYYKFALLIIGNTKIDDSEKLKALLFRNLALAYCQNNDKQNAKLFFDKAVTWRAYSKISEPTLLPEYAECLRTRGGY